jgi:hypothetical protein
MGIRPATKAIQRESIDGELLNCLWNALTSCLWNRWSPRERSGFQDEDAERVEAVVKSIWIHYFKRPVDTLPEFDPNAHTSAYDVIRDHFFGGEWWEVYDLIEFLIKRVPEEWKSALTRAVNHFMTAENAAYRIVGDEVVEITDEQEIEAIESALEKGLKACRSHLSHALQLLSDRKRPDYRNSIKESISAVEAVCKVVAGKPKSTLADCIKVISATNKIHPAFEQALLKLYGYTNDEGGIRHALTEESVTPEYSDAKFMLVAASAFVNFILAKAAELGIEIRQ